MEWFQRQIYRIYNYIDTLSDDDIIIFVDGFDSKIIKPLDEIEKRFLEMDCKVLFSLDPEIPGKYNTINTFSSCVNDNVVNSGLYMGYVKQLKPILKDSIHMK